MTDLQNHSQRTAADRAGFSERTARRFDTDPTPPSHRKIVHGRTVTDSLEDYWGILRGSRDFACIEDCRRFVDLAVARRKKQRGAAVQAEWMHLKPLPQWRTTDFTEIVAAVMRTGGFLIKSIFYSAPSQLIGQRRRTAGRLR